MLELLKKSKPTQVNIDPADPAQIELKRARKRVIMQASMTMLTLLLVSVVTFGMTAAWYTNVVQTGSLIFEVEKMGVNVNATVYANNFSAQPGDQGNISMEAENNGDETVRITVSVSKAGLDPQMQKRLFFYVDDQTLTNGELVERSYLTNDHTYAYTLFAGNSLTLTEAYHNNSQLKWCWVYDVLGYYVLGQAQEDTVAVKDYLRPIEYDYDSATFDAEGNLLTVDGNATADSFLNTLSQTDGYPGTISTADMVGRYYQVDVDENGYGVYAYLCNRSEVEDHTEYDTALGDAALQGNPATYTARFTINAEVLELTTVTVTNATELINALFSGAAEVVRLGSDVQLESNQVLNFAGGSSTILDLNGYTLSTDSGGYAWQLDSDASLSITGGSLNGNDRGNAFYLAGADLTLNDVDISGYNVGFRAADFEGTGQDSTLRLTNCNVETGSHLMMLLANGSMSDTSLQLMIEGCELSANYGYVIAGNGSVSGIGRWGTDIQVIGSRLIQISEEDDGYAAIFHPQPYSTLNIYDSYVSGYMGIVMKGGTLAVDQSEIVAFGIPLMEPALALSGYSDTGDAVYIESGYGYPIDVVIRDTRLESYYNQAYRLFEEETTVVTAVLENNTFIDESKQNAVP